MWIKYLLTGLAAGAAALLFTPFLIRWVTARRIIDQPRPGKIHPRPTPLLGGLAVGERSSWRRRPLFSSGALSWATMTPITWESFWAA